MMIATTSATCMAESTARIDSDAATRIPKMGNNFTSSATRGLCLGVSFGRLYSKKKLIMLFFRNYAKIMLLSENYALCHRNYAT